MSGRLSSLDAFRGFTIAAPIRNLPLAPVNTSLLYAVLFNSLMFGIAWIMGRNQWFVKV